MIPLADIDRLYEAVRRLRDERRKAEKLSERARTAAPGKAAQKATVDLHWQAMHVERFQAAAHAAAVDAGIADLRSPDHYAERIARPSAWHEYPWTPARPAALDDAPPASDRRP